MTRRDAILAVLIAVALLGVIATALVIGDDRQERPDWEEPNPVVTGAPEGLERFYTQDLEWDDCEQAKCTSIEVPLEYEKPEGKTLSLRVHVLPSSGDGGRSLFFNPGGPGAAAIPYVDYMAGQFGRDVRDRYDLVFLDPRGVGESSPLDCLSDRDLDAALASDPTPDDAAEIAAYRTSSAGFGAGCRQKSGDLAAHISTEEAARDFDIVRGLLGATTFDLFGTSYGAQLGATYATLFPANVGRMVLDGGIDISLTGPELALGQSEGFGRALRAYIEDCLRAKNCPLGRDVASAEGKLSDLLEAADATPLRAGESRRLTEGLMEIGLFFPLYAEALWLQLTGALKSAFKGDGSGLLRLSDQYAERLADGTYASNLLEAFPAVTCLDFDDRGTLEDVEKALPRFERVNPVFGRSDAWGMLGCADWPIRATHPQDDVDATGSKPIVVLGTTRDPATPYEWSEALVDQLRTGVLVTREGDGHGAYGSGNKCIDDLVNSYLAAGKVPKDGTTCKE